MREGEPKFDADGQNEEKRTSGVYKIVGFGKEEEQFIKEDFADLFEDQDFEEWEREKTPEEKEIINRIILRLPEFIKQFGGTPLALTQDHVHIIDEQKLPEKYRGEMSLRAGGYNTTDQHVEVYPIDIYGKSNKLHFAHTVVHELMHFLAFQSIQKHPKKELMTERRSGFSVRKNGGTEFYFDKVDEALIETAAIKFEDKYFSEIPQLAEELQKREMIKDLIVKDGNPKAAEMTAYINEIDGTNHAIPYSLEGDIRELRHLIKETYNSNKDYVASEEAVEQIYLQSLFTGKLLEIARMTKRLGRGDKTLFRRIGELTKRDRKVG